MIHNKYHVYISLYSIKKNLKNQYSEDQIQFWKDQESPEACLSPVFITVSKLT